MKPYIVSMVLGMLVGVIYALFGVRSPAPPIIALVGLLGILAGEQLPPLARQLIDRSPAAKWWVHHPSKPRMSAKPAQRTTAAVTDLSTDRNA